MYLELTTKEDDERPIFLSGDFCEWQPSDSKFRLEKIESKTYGINLDGLVDINNPRAYKYTRGSWDHVELDSWGNDVGNRFFEPNLSRKSDFVIQWRKNGYAPFYKESMPIIEVFSENFEIPQLSRNRRITVLLPHDYYENTQKTYPVLYMNDAQNLFGHGSAYGNWEIDKRLSLLKKSGERDVIVVAIDHGSENRNSEYSPYSTPTTNQKGEGMRYATFIVRVLKPLIDKKYRTQPERSNTGIGGSSMGGLISIYTGMMYPETIGRLMVFSPALWTSPKIYFDSVEFFSPLDTKIYIYGGGKESQTMFSNIEKLVSTIESQGHSADKLKIKAELDPEGLHNEARWGQEFPKAFTWLFGEE